MTASLDAPRRPWAYEALDRDGSPLITVLVDNEPDARRQISRELDRPGRQQFYKRWVAQGARVRPLYQ